MQVALKVMCTSLDVLEFSCFVVKFAGGGEWDGLWLHHCCFMRANFSCVTGVFCEI